MLSRAVQKQIVCAVEPPVIMLDIGVWRRLVRARQRGREGIYIDDQMLLFVTGKRHM